MSIGISSGNLSCKRYQLLGNQGTMNLHFNDKGSGTPKRDENISKIFEAKSLHSILQELSYPSIKEICYECLKTIDKASPSKQCIICNRCCHLECIGVMAQSNFEVRKQLQSERYECQSCLDLNKCLECKNYLDENDSQVYSCSVCLKRVHPRCHFVPSQFLLLNYRHLITQFKTGNLNHLQIVCKLCLVHFGVKDIIDQQTFNQVNYLFIKIFHLSPIHQTWIQENMLIESSRRNIEEKMTVSTEPEVEAIFSMYIPKKFENHSLIQIDQLLKNNYFLLKNEGKPNTFKFLVKWRHSFNSFVWEQASIFLDYKIYIIKFLHLLRMNYIAYSTIPRFVLNYHNQNCINNYVQEHKVLKNSQFCQFHLLDGVVHGEIRSERDKQTINLKDVYVIYQKKCKQYLNINSLALKVDTICHLINTIYFFDKNSAPIAIFTDESKVSWWIGHFLIKTPYLNTVALQGPQCHIEKIVEKYLLKVHDKEILLKFNILIFAYQSLKAISTLIDLKYLLEQFSLLIMDEKMTPLAKYYYSHVKIARIKFHKENKQEKLANLLQKCELPEEANSSQKKSSLTLSTSHNLKPLSNIDGGKGQLKSALHILCENFNELYTINNLNKNFLTEQQRLIFLRYVLQFGVNGQDKSDFCNKIITFQPIFFVHQQKSIVLYKLEEYTSYFLAHTNVYIYKACLSRLQEMIKRYFFFKIQPKYVLKVIADLSRVKRFCQLFQSEPNIELKLTLPFIDIEKLIECKGWLCKYDYFLCRGVLHYGYENWEKFSETPEDWRSDGELVTLRQYLCVILEVQLIPLIEFSQFLRRRLREITPCLQKMFV